MGGKQAPAPPQPTMEEVIIQMKMTAKRFTNESAKAEKQSKANITKAKAALKKNNQEGAKMYLLTAASKHSESLCLQRMNLRIDNLITQIKSGNSNQAIMANFNKITTHLHNSNQPSLQSMAENLETFEKTMDEMTVNGKVIDEMINKNTNSEATVQNMMKNLKDQMAIEVKGYVMKTMNEINEAAKLRGKQEEDKKFLENIKAL